MDNKNLYWSLLCQISISDLLSLKQKQVGQNLQCLSTVQSLYGIFFSPIMKKLDITPILFSLHTQFVIMGARNARFFIQYVVGFVRPVGLCYVYWYHYAYLGRTRLHKAEFCSTNVINVQ